MTRQVLHKEKYLAPVADITEIKVMTMLAMSLEDYEYDEELDEDDYDEEDI